MNKYKINIDREGISSEAIAQKRNFAEVQKLASVKTPFYKNAKFYLNSMAVLITIATLGYFLFKPANQQYTELTPFIAPPLKEVNIPFQEFQLDAAIANTIISALGSKVIIPAYAFADTNKNVTKGAIIFKLREFHNQADIFLSGIPMGYDSLGTNYTLESAGMIEVRAFQNGEELQLVSEMEIEVELVSNFKENDYNVYYLNEDLENWEYKGRDSLIMPSQKVNSEETVNKVAVNKTITNIQHSLDSIKTDIKQLSATEPSKPQMAVADKWKIELDVKTSEFPELLVYESTIWQFAYDTHIPDMNDADITWEDIIITKAEASNNYILTVKNGSEEKQYTVNPVYKGEAYAQEIKKYENKFRIYEAALTKRKTEEAKLLAVLEAEKERHRLRQQQEKELQAAYANTNNSRFGSDLYRRFSMTRLGVWNSDKIINNRSLKAIDAFFTDKNGEAINLKRVYVINKNRNTALRGFSQVDEDKVRSFKIMVNKSRGDILLGVNNEDKMVLLKESELNNALKGFKREVVFNLNVIDEDIISPSDFQELYQRGFDVN